MISPVNRKIAKILGTDIPPDDTPVGELVVVEPHELIGVENSDLPPLHDIHRKQLQADKQLEEVIAAALGYQKTLFESVDSVEPKYKSRYVEVANGTMGLALEAIKVKFKAQEIRMKQRLAEAGFQRPTTEKPDTPGTVNNFFYGSREELISAMRVMNEETPVEGPVEDK
jgi:hypothetical protein